MEHESMIKLSIRMFYVHVLPFCESSEIKNLNLI